MTCETLRHLPRLGIGDATRLFGITARALRYYEARGLVSARRDSRDCRFYDPEARRRLHMICALRAAGLPLEDIRKVLDAATDQDGRERALRKLRARRQAVQTELAQVDAAILAFAERTAAAARPERPRLGSGLGRSGVGLAGQVSR